MTKRLVLILIVFLGLFAYAASARAATPLRVGSHGQRVKDIQWLLSGHKPSVYRKTVYTYRGRLDGLYGPQTATAVKSAKWRLGYPMKNVDGRAGSQLFAFLLGKKARPLGWIGRASARAGRPGGFGETTNKALACGSKIVSRARSQIGVHEIPDGSNDGARVRVFQRVTGAFRAPWCASFVQWVLQGSIGHTIANRSAGVFYIVDWARRHALAHALPRVGAAVAYLRNLGHIGIVEKVTSTGFYAIEGNYSNSVQRVWHRTGDQRTVFIYAGCSS